MLVAAQEVYIISRLMETKRNYGVTNYSNYRFPDQRNIVGLRKKKIAARNWTVCLQRGHLDEVLRKPVELLILYWMT